MPEQITNMTEVSRLVVKAQGKRSLRAFAKDLGCHPSTLSRIISGQTLPRDEDLISAICRSAEESVSEEELREAIRQDEAVRRSSVRERRSTDQRAFLDTLNSALLNGGYSAVQIRDQSMPRNIDVAYLTNAISGTDAECWAFEFQPSLPSSAAALILQRILFAAGRIYFGGMRYRRFSVVTADREAFERFKEDNEGQMPIPDELSVVLIDPEEREVIDEYVLPTTDKTPTVYPFKTNE